MIDTPESSSEPSGSTTGIQHQLFYQINLLSLLMLLSLLYSVVSTSCRDFSSLLSNK